MDSLGLCYYYLLLFFLILVPFRPDPLSANYTLSRSLNKS